MNRVCCDMSVQTDAVSCSEQCVQVDVGQSTQWTQCGVDQTDQLVQAVCTQLPAAVQVAPQTSNAFIQTLLAVAEPAERLSDVVSEDKMNAESESVGHCQAEEGACIVMCNEEGEVADSLSAAEGVNIADSPHHCAIDSASSNDQLQHQEDCSGSNSQATRVEFTYHDGLPGTLAVDTPVTSGTISTVSERQLRSQYDGGGISQLSAVIRKPFPATAVSDVRRSAVLQPPFTLRSSHTATNYVYSFERRTFLARSLMLKQSSEVSTVVSVQHSVDDDASLPCKTQESVTQCAAEMSACLPLHLKPGLEVCTSDVETATIGGEAAALKPLVPAFDTFVSNWQQVMLTSHVDDSSSQSQVTTEQATVMTKKQDTWSDSLPSVSLPADVIQNMLLPAIETTDSTIANNSFRLEESAVNETVVHPSKMVSVTATEDDKFSADVVLSEGGDYGKLGSNPEVVGCETASTCDQSWAAESQSSAQDNSVRCPSGRDVTTACAGKGSTADNGQRYDSKEQKTTMLTEVSRLSDSRGRRRPLFVHKGPLMETVTTSGGSTSTSAHHVPYKDSESSTRKLPVMLMGMF